MRRRRRYPCWWFAPFVALALLALVTCVPGKGIIDGALEDDARKALTGAGLDTVTVDFDWGKGVLTGPPEVENAALLVVDAAMDDFDTLRYVADASLSTPTTTTTPSATTSAAATTTAASTTAATAAPTTAAATTAPSTTAATTPPTTVAAAAGVNATGEVVGNQITLRGTVATAALRDAIVGAASGAFGPTKVVDQLTVQAGAAPPAAITEAVDRFATLLGAAGPRLGDGRLTIVDTAITVTGTAFNPQAQAELNQAVAQAAGGGVTATGSVTSAVADRATLQVQLQALLGRSGINFASGSAEIDDQSQAVLDTASASIVALPGVRIAIEGHTDDVGSASSNLTLSQRRAEAVLAYLVERGVPADQLTATGFGPDRPIADNGTAEGRATNRRIEFAVSGS